MIIIMQVMGYNNAVHFFGSVFEAETNCIAEHNMGQVRLGGEKHSVHCDGVAGGQLRL